MRSISYAVICILVFVPALSCLAAGQQVVEGASDNSTEIAVADGGWPYIIAFNVNADNITPGENLTLTWDVRGTDNVSIDQGIGEVPPAGSIELSPVKSTRYTITGRSGKGVAQAWVNVTVAPLTSIMPDLAVTGVTHLSGLLYYRLG